MKSIGSEAFSKCGILTSITIGEGLTTIGSDAFSSCKGLKSIILPKSLTSIGDSAFAWCEALQSIVIPKSVTRIPERAFMHCKALQSVTLPSNLDRIESEAFYNCSKLKSLTIPNNYASIDLTGFNGTVYDGSFKPSSKITNSSIAGLRKCSTYINGAKAEIWLALFDNGTYIKRRADLYTAELIEVGTFTIKGQTLTLKVAGNVAKKNPYVFTRMSGGETLSINAKTGSLSKYGQRLRLRNSYENSSYDTWTSNDIYNNQRLTQQIIDALKRDLQVTVY